MILLLLSALTIFIFFIITLINILFGPYLRDGTRYSLKSSPTVSVLIPARNEEENITRCLQSILSQDYPILEMVVLDDQSEDNTFAIVAQIVRDHSNVHCLAGKSLPEGWLGKNWACWQLAQQAKGEILLFVDADTWQHTQALRATIGWMQAYNLGMLSAFPQQRAVTFWEKLFVPLIDFILYSFLPLKAVYYIPCKAFSAANGQWIAFDRSSYQKIGGHQAVRNSIVEDVELARLTKQYRIHMMTTAGTGMVFCRMYQQMTEIWHGLTKIMYGISANNPVILFSLLLLFTLAYIMPFIILVSGVYTSLTIILIFIIMIQRIIFAKTFRHDLWLNIIFIPVTVIFGMIIAINSFYQSKYGKFVWKGREIKSK
jgi:chlorobactene glucosyltransferase